VTSRPTGEHVEEASEVLEEVLGRVAEDLLHGRAHVVEVRIWLEDEAPHHVGRLVREVTKSALTLCQLRFGDVTRELREAVPDDLLEERVEHLREATHVGRLVCHPGRQSLVYPAASVARHDTRLIERTRPRGET
jgi:hypothetical protein